MSDVIWLSRAELKAEVYTIAVGGTWLANDTLTLTVGGAKIVITVGATVSTSHIAEAIVAAWNGDDLDDTELRTGTGNLIPSFSQITATVNGSTVTLTGDTLGVPFIVSVSETSASGTLTLTNTVNATGPNDVANVINYSSGALPTTGDRFFVPPGSTLLYGLDAITDTLAETFISAGAIIGLPSQNPSGYAEYLPTYLTLKSTVVHVNTQQNGVQASSRMKIDSSSVQTLLTAYSSGGVNGLELPIQWKGTHASNVVDVRSGVTLGIATLAAEVATVPTLRVSSGATVVVGEAVTLTTVSSNGSTIDIKDCAVTTLNMTGTSGVVTFRGTAALGTGNVQGGKLAYQSSGNITSLVLGGYGTTGTYDTTGDQRTRTVASVTLKKGARIVDAGLTTFTDVVIDGTVKSISVD